MSRTRFVLTPRAEELLIQRALVGLDDAEAAELRALGHDSDDSFDLAAAAVDLATLSSPHQQMPAGLLAGIIDSAQRSEAPFIGGADAPVIVHSAPPQRSLPRRRGLVHQLGWLAAAASLAVAVGALWYARRPVPPVAPTVVYREAPPAPQPTPAQEREQLLRTSTDAMVLKWKPTADVASKGAAGDVVWSASAQRGFMRFSGIAPNDGQRWQYQLWIFDKVRDARYPVDGGVFDVATRGEVIVPITARLHVSQPVLFAVTVERPGGVVVSRRERIVVTAAPTG